MWFETSISAGGQMFCHKRHPPADKHGIIYSICLQIWRARRGMRHFWSVLAISRVIFIDLQGGSGPYKLFLCDNLLLATKAVIRRKDPVAFSSNCIVIAHQSPGAARQNSPAQLLFLTTATTNKVSPQHRERKIHRLHSTILLFALYM